jgi:hypothetical protein
MPNEHDRQAIEDHMRACRRYAHVDSVGLGCEADCVFIECHLAPTFEAAHAASSGRAKTAFSTCSRTPLMWTCNQPTSVGLRHKLVYGAGSPSGLTTIVNPLACRLSLQMAACVPPPPSMRRHVLPREPTRNSVEKTGNFRALML